MINLKPTNIKLRQRVIRIASDLTGCDAETVEQYLEMNEWDIKKTVDYVKNK